ncbi:substrate-binding periplasmic protein [Paraglaciecola aestuariivivens]
MQRKLTKLLHTMLFIGCSVWVTCQALASVPLNQLTFITESSASYNFVRDGKLQGPAVDLLLAASQYLNSPIQRDDILVLPWSRGFKQAIEGPNKVLFSTIRTSEREAKFQWVGPIATESDVLIAAKSRKLVIADPKQMKDYLTGAVRGDVGEEILLSEGVPMRSIVLLSHSTNLGKMLAMGRIDLWIFGEDGWRESLLASNLNPNDFEVVYRFPAKRYYFALSQDVDKHTVQKLQNAVEKVLQLHQLNF